MATIRNYAIRRPAGFFGFDPARLELGGEDEPGTGHRLVTLPADAPDLTGAVLVDTEGGAWSIDRQVRPDGRRRLLRSPTALRPFGH